jgi:FkbM family methyltransferase
MSDKKFEFFRQTFRTLFVKPLLALNDRWPFLKDNFIWRSIKPYYHYFFEIKNFGCLGENSVAFYNQNAERVNTVADMLADEKSKAIYVGSIKFRQTRNRKDFPVHPFKEEQYFIKELRLGKDEVFIDGGASIGDTIVPFIRRCKKYKQIIAFEPDSASFEKLKERYGNNPRITLVNAGLYNKDGEVLFAGEKGEASKIVHQGDFTGRIKVKTIDGLDLERVTFIKMDIEGAELNALKGAQKTILRDKPKLAICIYHSDEDMIRIAEYIHSLVPEYKLYVRQYALATETVLYAILPSSMGEI